MRKQIPPVLIVFLDEALLQRRTSETVAVEPICMNVGRRESRREEKTKAPHESRGPKRLLWPGFSAQPGEPLKSHLWPLASILGGVVRGH